MCIQQPHQFILSPTSLDENSTLENLQVHIKAPRRSNRVPRQLDRYVGHIVMDDVNTLHLKDSDPLTYDKAVNNSNSKKWRETMDSEIQSILSIVLGQPS